MRMQEDTPGSVDEREEDAASALADRSPMLEISNAMVRLYKEAFGRGPTEARAQCPRPADGHVRQRHRHPSRRGDGGVHPEPARDGAAPAEGNGAAPDGR
jgi:hypothetical protein